MKRCRGHLWFMCRYGVCKWARYERARRSGMTVDYSEILTADECAVLAEHTKRVPWAPKNAR